MRVLLLPAAATAVAALAAGCGGSSGADRPPSDADAAALTTHRAAVDPPTAALTTHRAAVDPPRREFRPRLTGREFLQIRLTGDQMGTSDGATYGDDGSVVLVRAYGGGGFYTFGCRLSAGELQALRHDAARLPLDRAPKVRERARPTFYTIPAASYVVERGRYVGSFTADAMPADGRPLARHIKRLMHGQEGRCSKAYANRTR
jgi:hypothetical protein